MRLKNLSPGQKIKQITGLGLAVLLSISWLSYSSTTELFKSFGWVYHTHEVLEKIGVLTNELSDIQRSARGYVITGDEKYLAPYQTALTTIPATFSEAVSLTADNPRQQANLAVLKPQVDAFLGIYAQVVQLRKTVGEAQIARFIKKGTGSAALNAVMQTLGVMNQEENRLLVLRNQEESRRATDTRWFIFIFALFSAVITVGAGVNINRHLQAEKAALQKIGERDAIIAQFLEGLPIGVFVIQADGEPYYANRAALNLLGRDLTPVHSVHQLRKIYQAYLADTDEIYPAEKSPLIQALRGQKTTQDDMEIRQPGGKVVPLQVTGTPIFGNDGEIAYALTAFLDISERKKYQADLKNLSILDELTGLLNRRGFLTLAEQQIKTADRTQSRLLMVFIDLDGLKKVNDGLGHQAGDEMIIEFAKILKEHFRKVDITARMGGDEFAILAMDPAGPDEGILQRLREKVEERNATATVRYRLDFSVGSAFYDPKQPCPLDELVSRADRQMYEEKNKKKNPPPG